MIRRHRFALALLTLVAAVLFLSPLIRGEVFTFRDHTDYFQPLRWYTAEQLKLGRLPLWNPYNASGEPWLANPQTAVFYPPALLFLLLPFPTAYMSFLLVHLLILGIGSYALFRRLAPAGGAMAGAVAMMLCGPVLSLLDINNNLATFAWLPLVLWCALERRGGEESARGLAGSRGFAALVLALSFLGGEPFFAMLGAVAFALITRRPREIALTGAAAAALCAIQLVPFLEYTMRSDRGGALHGVDILRDSVPARDWLRLAVPPRLTPAAFDPQLTQHFIPTVYVGFLIVMLAAWAVVAAALGRANRKVVLSALAVLALSMIVAAGSYLPPVGEVITASPLTLFRYPARLIPIGAFAVIALAAVGWSSAGARLTRHRWMELLLVLALILDLLPRAAPLLATSRWSRDIVPHPPTVGRSGKIVRVTDDARGLAAGRRAWIAGYLNLYERRFDAWTAAPLAARKYTRLYELAVSRPRLDLLDVLPAGYVLSARNLEPRFVAQGNAGPVRVFRNPGALPMATYWGRPRTSASGDDAYRALMEGGDARQMVIAPAAEKAYEGGVAMILGAQSIALTSTLASVSVDAPRDGVVVLAQQDAPGWRVYVDGREEQKLLGHGIFRAVAVTSGRHDITWRYEPRSLVAGAALTMLAIAWLIFFEWRFIDLKSFVKRWRTKKFSSIGGGDE